MKGVRNTGLINSINLISSSKSATVRKVQNVESAKKNFGFINLSGRLVVNLRYDDADDFSENRAKICADGSYGFIDTSGKMLSANEYEAARSFSEVLAAVRVNGKRGYIGHDGAL